MNEIVSFNYCKVFNYEQILRTDQQDRSHIGTKIKSAAVLPRYPRMRSVEEMDKKLLFAVSHYIEDNIYKLRDSNDRIDYTQIYQDTVDQFGEDATVAVIALAAVNNCHDIRIDDDNRKWTRDYVRESIPIGLGSDMRGTMLMRLHVDIINMLCNYAKQTKKRG